MSTGDYYLELKRLISAPGMVKELTHHQANVLLAEARYVQVQCEETMRSLNNAIHALTDRLAKLKSGEN